MTDNADILTHLLSAIATKFSGSAFSTAVNGQLFQDEAPEGTPYPYAVFSIISAPKEKTFSEEYRNILLQLDIFSSASSPAEIKDAYQHASDLFDECALTITGSTLVWMREMNLVAMMEEYPATTEGTQKVRHYAVDFEVTTKLN